MAGIRIAKVAKATKAVKSSGPTLPGFHKEWNGKGGFKPGNKYGAKSHGDAAPVARQGRLDFSARPEPVKIPDSPKIPNVNFENPKYREYAKSQEKYNKEMAEWASKRHGKEPSVYLEHAGKSLKDIVDAGDHYIRIESKNLEKVLEEGRFKSQFETRRSNGSYSPSTRMDVESRKIGVGESVTHEQRPIYGYVSGKDFSLFGKDSELAVSNYGEVSVKLKPSIRDRATVTAGDSLGAEVAARPANNPDHLAADGFLRRLHDYHDDSKLTPHEKLANFAGAGGFSYIESQYHGGVSVHDIDEVAFRRKPSPAIENLLKLHGIKHRIIRANS